MANLSRSRNEFVLNLLNVITFFLKYLHSRRYVIFLLINDPRRVCFSQSSLNFFLLFFQLLRNAEVVPHKINHKQLIGQLVVPMCIILLYIHLHYIIFLQRLCSLLKHPRLCGAVRFRF